MRELSIKLVTWLLFLFLLSLVVFSTTSEVATSPLETFVAAQANETDPADRNYSLFIPTVLSNSDSGSEEAPPAEPGGPGDPEDPGPPEEPGNPEGPGEPELPGEYVEKPTGFEIDGNTALDEPGLIDWETSEFPPAVHILDPHSKGARDTNVFKPNGKFDQPEKWRISQGKVGPPQTELTNVMSWFVKTGDLGPGEPSESWLILSMERSKTEGTFYLDFEYNKMAWDGASGGLIRSPGDLSVGFAIHGNPNSVEEDLRLFIIQYYPGQQPFSCSVTAGPGGKPEIILPGAGPCPAFGDGGWFYRFLGSSADLADSGLGEATMNEQAIPAMWPSFDSHGDPRDEIGPFQFAEAAINLDALNIELSCGSWGSVHAKGRSSIEPKSDLKDLAGPIPLENNCRLEGHKFLDINGDGLWDESEPPLSDWEIHLTARNSTSTDEHGHYEFENLEDGLYRVRESCPEGWVQTAPAPTDFEGCGSESFEVDISTNNSNARELDFGNGRPELSLRQSCPGDVFLGDDILYSVQFTNEGNVDLLDVVIDEPEAEAGLVIDRLQPGQSGTLTYSVVAAEPGVVLKKVNGEGEYALATVMAQATEACKTMVHSIEVKNDAQVNMDRRYLWTITKEVDDPGPIVIVRGRALMPTYTVTVGLDDPAYIDGDSHLTGTITVSNPAPMPATLASVVDVMEPGIDIPVTCPGLVVPAGGSLVCSYGPVDIPGTGIRLNTATATLINNNGDTTDFKDSVEVDLDDPDLNHIDGTVDVIDSMADSLGQVHYWETPKTITYSHVIGPIEDSCRLSQFENIATYHANDSGATGQASAMVEVFVLCAVRIGFEDLELGEGNDWDYNDLVVDVDVRVELSGNPAEPDLEAVHLGISRLVGGPEFSGKTHEFHIAPDVFECDGTYLMRSYFSDGTTADKSGKYKIGDDFLIFSEARPLPYHVDLSIFFDVPPEGCPCNKDVLGDPLNTFHGEALFFRPWMKAMGKGDTVIVIPGDSRLLAVPDIWQWPAEKQHIWEVYPKVTAGDPPTFVPFWWLP